jgi:hypothetical protein
MAGMQGARTVVGVYTAAQTNIDIVAVPASGQCIVIQWLVFANGATAAGDFKLLNGPVISAAITANSQANPTVVTCGVYVPTGSTVTITGSNSTPLINGTYVATNVNSTSFSIPVNVTVAGTAGTVAATGTTLAAGLLTANTPLVIDCKRAPLVLTAATPLCFTSATATTHRVNIGYTIEKA